MTIASDQVLRDKLGEGIILSTVKPMFMAWYGPYETAITFDNQKSWRILEGYGTLEEAKKGHEKYKNMSIEKLRKFDFIG